LPIGIAWAPTENTAAMTLLFKQVAVQCEMHGVDCPFKHEHPKEWHDPRDNWMAPDWVDPLSDDIICYPPLRAFVKSVLDGEPDINKFITEDTRSTFMSDGGSAFKCVAKLFNLHHLLCKKHLSANNPLGSTNDK
jgi:hypothetical protein